MGGGLVDGEVEVGNTGVEKSKVDLNVGLLEALDKGDSTGIAA